MKILVVFCFCFLYIINACIRQSADVKKDGDLLSLSEKDFFKLKPGKRLEFESDLLDSDFYGILLKAPAKINTQKRNILPVIVGVSCTGEKEWEFPIKQNCYLVATDLTNGYVHIGKLFTEEKEKLPSQIKKGSPATLPEKTSTVTSINIKEIIDIPWEAGDWSISVIYYDWISNSVRISLEGNKKLLDTELNKYSPEKYPILPYSIISGDSLTQHEKGLNFTIKYSKDEKKQSLILEGAFSLEKRGYHQIQKSKMDQDLENNISTVVPITLFLLPVTEKYFVQYNFSVPVLMEKENASYLKQNGFFNTDILKQFKDAILLKDSYLAYVITDGIIFGPKDITIY